MEAILGLLGICGANCAEDRDEAKARAGESVRAFLHKFAQFSDEWTTSLESSI